MSDIMNAALATLQEKLDGTGMDSGTLKITISDEGSLVIDENGASLGDAETDCTLSADAETVQGMLDGEIDPTSAFMGGKLSVDGDMSVAMQLASKLA